MRQAYRHFAGWVGAIHASSRLLGGSSLEATTTEFEDLYRRSDSFLLPSKGASEREGLEWAKGERPTQIK